MTVTLFVTIAKTQIGRWDNSVFELARHAANNWANTFDNGYWANTSLPFGLIDLGDHKWIKQEFFEEFFRRCYDLGKLSEARRVRWHWHHDKTKSVLHSHLKRDAEILGLLAAALQEVNEGKFRSLDAGWMEL